MLIGYIRVSTQDQNPERQIAMMQELGIEELYIDKASGKNTDRPELKKLLDFARKGDTVVVESISRFARNTRDLLDLIEVLNGKGVEFVSKKESIDTTTPTGKFMLTVCSGCRTRARVYTAASERRNRSGKEEGGIQGKEED